MTQDELVADIRQRIPVARLSDDPAVQHVLDLLEQVLPQLETT